MFCYQCQEAFKNEGCQKVGVCGKSTQVAELQDALIYSLKGVSLLLKEVNKIEEFNPHFGQFICHSLFTTITNANFDQNAFVELIHKTFKVKKLLCEKLEQVPDHETVNWIADSKDEILEKALKVGVLSTENEDQRSLRELLILGVKGMAAYAHHAFILGYEDEAIYQFVIDALASTTKDLSVDEMLALVMKAGEMTVTTLALLDKANSETYGKKEITEVSCDVGDRPGILISGHDLKDLKELLEQTKDKGIHIYTHSEMLPAHYYPEFKKYAHLKGNYGGAWYTQSNDFESFNGPILMTTNCITPVKDSYKDRIFTTGAAGYEGVKHIPNRENGSQKDFSQIIELALTCKAPTSIEDGTIVGGFGHQQVIDLADKVVSAIKEGHIKRFFVMAGCDGRLKSREYFTEVAEALPNDSVILTAGCAKYRYNKLQLGDIGGIPRVLDAGQCNDSYSLAVIALKLKEVFELQDINELPISFDIAWYEQKAVAVLLALLFLGVKGIRLGPTLPAFVSKNVLNVLVEKFDIKPTEDVQKDVELMMAGK